VKLCEQLDLFSDALVAIDGSKFKAVNNRGRKRPISYAPYGEE
jgi:transposase